MRSSTAAVAILWLVLVPACVTTQTPASRPQRVDPVLDVLQQRTFLGFWEATNPSNGLVPDRYEEAMLLYVLAMGSPTHPISADAWPARTNNYKWNECYGHEFVNYAPLFIHQYSHIWVDFRGIQDHYIRGNAPFIPMVDFQTITSASIRGRSC